MVWVAVLVWGFRIPRAGSCLPKVKLYLYQALFPLYTCCSHVIVFLTRRAATFNFKLGQVQELAGLVSVMVQVFG